LKQAIARLVEPSVQCLGLVHNELQYMIEHSLRAELESFPMMASAVQEQTQNFMQDCLRPAEQMIRSLVDCHLSYINMSHPQFVGATEALRIADQWVQQSNQPPPSAENGGVLDSHKLAPEHAGHGAATHAPSRPGSSGVAQLLDDSETGSPKRGQGLRSFLQNKLATKQGNTNLRSHALRKSQMKGDEKPFTQQDGNITLHDPPSELPAQNTEEDDNQALQITTTRVLLNSYYAIVRGSLQDMVPKAIMNFLVNQLNTGIEQHLIRILFREECFSELLAEPIDIAKKRQRAHETCTALRSAVEAMEQVQANVARGKNRSSKSEFEFGKENESQNNRSHRRQSDGTSLKPAQGLTEKSGVHNGSLQ